MASATITTLTEWEAYQVAFLVSRGWRMAYGGGSWSKPGKVRRYWDADSDREAESPEFKLDDAYYSEDDDG